MNSNIQEISSSLDNISCSDCKEPIVSHYKNKCKIKIDAVEENFLTFLNINRMNISEIETRNKQSEKYKKYTNIKYTFQKKILSEFLSNISIKEPLGEILDLGTGIGPTPKLYFDKNYQKISCIDFSIDSLLHNKRNINNSFKNVFWINSDISKLYFAHNSYDLIVASDFIQHINGHTRKLEIIKNLTDSLKPKGSFYLSFFNFNILHYFRGDRIGKFDGIKYERLILSEVENIITDKININSIIFQIFHIPWLDKFLSKFRIFRFLARWIIICGEKK
jgi:SAM-dependent methyltransferase